MAQTRSMVADGCFQKNILKALKIKDSGMVRPTKQQQPLSPEKWEGTIDHAQFLKRASPENECDVDIFQEAAVEWNCRRD